METLKNRIDFVYLIDVQDGNPNGDPDAGNLPRVDAETGMGIITDVCLKRKVRNYVQLAKECAPGYDIFVKEKAILNNLIEASHDADVVKAVDKEADKEEAARQEMCRRYFDVRTFGAVMSTGKKKAGQVRGPIQLTFARSVDSVVISEHTITRVAVTKSEDAGKPTEMGRKATIPYGLYVCHGFVTPSFARATGFTEADLSLFWEALVNMFDCDHSSARGLMTPRKLFVFRHATALGSASASSLFERISICRKSADTPARSFADYEITVNQQGLSDKHIELQELI